MSLQFIFGNSGSGKSGYLYRTVLKQAKATPEQNFLVIVPEQFTMQTQRELVQMQENHAIMNVDVLSFARLAYRVFDELGKQNLVVLEETGKNLVLRKVAQQKKKELKVLGGSMNKMGCISEVKSLISEMTQYNVKPEDVERFLKAGSPSETLRLKMQDILTMYHGFAEYMEGKYITAEEVLSLLCEVAGESVILKNSVIVFDEFTGFTPIQNRLLYELMPIAEKLIVSVTMDTREDFYHSRGIHELFAMSKKTIQTLLKTADELHIPIEEPVVLKNGERLRYQNAPALFFMEQQLFRPAASHWEGENENIRITGLKNPREELKFAAHEIIHLVREKHLRYKDIALVTGDVNQYANYVPEIFGQYGIPYFIDQTKNILFHPFIEFIRAVLEVVEFDFSYESVFRFLRCGLTTQLLALQAKGCGEKEETEGAAPDTERKPAGLTDQDIDCLENYVLAKGIRGKKRWSQSWTFVTGGGMHDDMQRLNHVRACIYERFLPLLDVFGQAEGDVRTQTFVLYQFITELGVERQLKQRELDWQERGDLAKAREYAQIYKIVMDLLDKVVTLLGEEKISVREYADILDAGFEAAKVGMIPTGNDKVTVGDIERTRLNHIRVLFFVGVNDGVVPKAGNAGGIISQFEREKMAQCHLELAPGAREKVFIQKFYLYLNMTKPSDFLYVTFSGVNQDGKALRPSYLIGSLRKLFPGMAVKEQGRDTDLVTPESSLAFFLEGLQKHGFERTKELPALKEVWTALANWYLSKEDYREEITRLIGAAYQTHTDEPISHAVTQALYGTVLENSVTRLERFAACAFAHYLNYGLQLRERQMQEFTSVDMGNIYHDALEQFAKKIGQSEFTWFDLPDSLQELWIEECMEEAVLGCADAGIFGDARNRYLLERMKATVKRTVWALMLQIRKGHFTPSEFEVSFSKADDLEAVNFTLSEEEKMRLQGRIDRIDTYETDQKVYVKIIDYKSGNTSFSLLNLYHGLQLQLVVYLNAALELVAKKHPQKKAEPAGIFYYHIDNPMVEGNGTESESEIRRAVLEQLKLNGLVNEDPDIYRAMDTDFAGSSAVIPVALKADGSLKATSKTVGTSGFGVMSDYVKQIIVNTGRQILAGEAGIRPYQLDNGTGCDYCPYHTICGFDPRIPGYEYRVLEKFDDGKAILEKMKGIE